MRIVIIGSGNIAHFFVPLFQQAGHTVLQIYSPNIHNAAALANANHIPSFTNELDSLIKDADVYILAVKDDALKQLNAQLRLKDKIVIHCAGAVPVSVIKDISDHTAVIWTLYSIRKNNLPTINKVPLIVEAADAVTLPVIMELAGAISASVLNVDFQQRQRLHLNAVFVNNFSNHLFTIAQKLSEEEKLPFNVLQPIMEQTIFQLRNTLPSESQTGPAIRKDEATMQKHLSLLEGHGIWQEIYRNISQSIQQST